MPIHGARAYRHFARALHGRRGAGAGDGRRQSRRAFGAMAVSRQPTRMLELSAFSHSRRSAEGRRQSDGLGTVAAGSPRRCGARRAAPVRRHAEGGLCGGPHRRVGRNRQPAAVCRRHRRRHERPAGALCIHRAGRRSDHRRHLQLPRGQPAGMAERAVSYLDDGVLEAIAREHDAGRRLLVALTGSPARAEAVWDIGRVAASRHPKSGALDKAGSPCGRR